MSTSKEIERAELNQAIQDFLSTGHEIKALDPDTFFNLHFYQIKPKDSHQRSYQAFEDFGGSDLDFLIT